MSATKNWENWRWQIGASARTREDLLRRLPSAPRRENLEEGDSTANRGIEIPPLALRYPLKVTPYYLNLASRLDLDDPVIRQVIPSREEQNPDPLAIDDPIGDRRRDHRPIPAVIHRYPRRALFIPTWSCAVNCRFCFRREREQLEGNGVLEAAAIEAGIGYLEAHDEIREVILTGGDPLMLEDHLLLPLLERLAALPHLRFLRLHTRMPVVNPFRLTPAFCQALARIDATLWVATHFNHPAELAPPALERIGGLIDCGIPVLNQSVLLRGVNDDCDTLEELVVDLLAARIKPYYLHHPDRARGTGHLRVCLRRGAELMRTLRARVPGHAVPHYVLDLPGGYGKVPLEAQNWIQEGDGLYRITAPDGSIHTYVDIPR